MGDTSSSADPRRERNRRGGRVKTALVSLTVVAAIAGITYVVVDHRRESARQALEAAYERKAQRTAKREAEREEERRELRRDVVSLCEEAETLNQAAPNDQKAYMWAALKRRGGARSP